MASSTRWTWVWVNSGSWWWTGRPGVLRFMGLQRVRHDWATELNWAILERLSDDMVLNTDYFIDFMTSTLCVLNYFTHVWLFATLWTITCQAPMTMGFSRPRILERVAMPFSRGILPTQGLNLCLLRLLHCWQFLDSLSNLGSLTSILLNFFLCSWYLFSSVYWVLTRCPIVTIKIKIPPLKLTLFPCLSSWSYGSMARKLSWLLLSFVITFSESLHLLSLSPKCIIRLFHHPFLLLFN